MRTFKNIVGIALIVWGAVRFVPDSLESAKATATDAHWLYVHFGAPHSLFLSVVVLVVGVGLIFAEPLQRLASQKLPTQRPKDTISETSDVTHSCVVKKPVDELNRPSLGIADVELVKIGGVPANFSGVVPAVRQIIVTLKNYGTIPAKGVVLNWKAYMGVVNETRNNSSQGPFDLAQGASCPISLSVRIMPEDAARIRTGGSYKIEIDADYATPDAEHRWKYSATRVLRPPDKFTMDDQPTDRTEEIS